MLSRFGDKGEPTYYLWCFEGIFDVKFKCLKPESHFDHLSFERLCVGIGVEDGRRHLFRITRVSQVYKNRICIVSSFLLTLLRLCNKTLWFEEVCNPSDSFDVDHSASGSSSLFQTGQSARTERHNTHPHPTL